MLPASVVAQNDLQRRCVTFEGSIPDSTGEVIAALLNGSLAITTVQAVGECVSAAMPSQQPAGVLYEAKTAEDFEQWEMSDDWGVAGDQLASSGGSFYYITLANSTSGMALAPIEPEDQRHGIEVVFQVIGSPGRDTNRPLCLVCSGQSLGILARTTSRSGYIAALAFGERLQAGVKPFREGWNSTKAWIGQRPAELSKGEHVLRLELRGNQVTLWLDDKKMVDAPDNQALEPGRVGVFSQDAQMSVKRFTVYSLPGL
jgi:hypothetical protein